MCPWRQNVEEIIMKTKNLGIVVFLVAIAVTMGSASAATVNVNSSMSNTAIQNAITGATAGDTINFAPGTYTGIHLTVSKALNLVGNGATLIGSGTSILTISGSGISINSFNININNTGADGITGQNVYNCNIQNNNITNGDDGINIFKQYGNLTINNNRITNMNDARDGISLVNCVSQETSTSTTITNNVVNGMDYGIFIGGHFRGTISGNTLTNIGTTGMELTIKQGVGNLYANITYNNVTTAGTGMSFGTNTYYLYLHNNIISSTGDSIAKSSDYYVDNPDNIDVDGNTCNNNVADLTSNG